jgi:hypothetical protein
MQWGGAAHGSFGAATDATSDIRGGCPSSELQSEEAEERMEEAREGSVLS